MGCDRRCCFWYSGLVLHPEDSITVEFSTNFRFTSSLMSQYELSSLGEFWITFSNEKYITHFVLPSPLVLTVEGSVSLCPACPCRKFEGKVHTAQTHRVQYNVFTISQQCLIFVKTLVLRCMLYSLILILSTTEYWQIIWPLERPLFLLAWIWRKKKNIIK